MSCIVRMSWNSLNAQWLVQQVPTTQQLRDLYFSDTSKGWVLGSGGLFHTTDGGLTWTPQTSGIGSISGVSVMELWATHADTILHTTDEGTTFSRRTLRSYFDYDSMLYLTKVYFYDSSTGWVAAFGWKNNQLQTQLINTTDGGNAWQRQYIQSVEPLSQFPLIQFINPNLGWFTANSTSLLFRTTDGGITWDSLTYVDYLSNVDMQFITDEIGWISSDAPVLATDVVKTIDSGKTWSSPLRFENSDIATHLRFSDTLNGWVVQTTYLHGVHTEIWHTSDGGSNWNLQYSYAPSFYYRASKVFFVDKYHGWIVGENGIVLHTSNGGVTAVTETWDASTGFSLMQNYPNPFNPATTIGYQVRQNSRVSIRIDDILGRPVKVLLDGQVPPGVGSLLWDGRDERGVVVGAGVYFCHMIVKISEIKERTATWKIVLVR